MVAGADTGDLAAQAQGDAEGLEVDVERGLLGLAEQHRLGQRGPVVGLVGFGADEGDGAGEALFPQGDRGLDARHARARDDDPALGPLCPLLLAHPSTLRT